MNKGLLYAIATYLMWGVLPIYWKLVQHVPAIEILGHRIVWSLIFVLALLGYKKEWSWLQPALKNRRTLLIFGGASLLVGLNWFIYIWAVTTNRIVETSLGYFINPLVSVVLGVIFLQEQLRRGQWLAVLLAASGVFYLTISLGALPWISLVLAISFGAYGLLKKLAPLGAIEGLSLETAILFLPAFIFLLSREIDGTGAFGGGPPAITILLLGAGVITAIPLLTFAAAAQRIPLSMLGILQYITPTLQFLIGVVIYLEPFDIHRLIGFSLIWAALIFYTVEGFTARRTVITT